MRFVNLFKTHYEAENEAVSLSKTLTSSNENSKSFSRYCTFGTLRNHGAIFELLSFVEKPKDPESGSTLCGRDLAMEAAGLGGFVVGAGLMVIALEHPDGPAMQTVLQGYPIVRHAILGVVMGLYITLVAVLWGNKSGAHINPAVTWTYYALGRIQFAHAGLYTLAQFTGAIAGALLLKATSGTWFSNPAIDYGVTRPMPPYGSVHAFVAEALISFVLMAVTLMAITSKRWEKRLAVITGVLIALYLTFELPLSGMSLNPARSTAGALAANEWEHLWIYFVAPTGAMLAAGALFPLWKKHRTKTVSGAADWKPLPQFPVAEEAG